MDDADIVIPQDKIQDFFFLDDDEEQEKYGFSSKQAAVALSGGILKEKSKDESSKYKQIQDFKIRVLDFIGIYIKEMTKKASKDQSFDSIDLIKGLLKGLQVAHQDRNMNLFDRIKSVISIMARGTQGSGEEKDSTEQEGSVKQNKIIMTELMSLLLKQSKDQQMQKAYSDCFLFLTKYFIQLGNPQMQKFIVFTYKELLRTFLQGRNTSGAVNVKFFQAVFEQNPGFGWNFSKILLKCIVDLKPSAALPNNTKEEEAKAQDAKNTTSNGKGKKKRTQDDDSDGEGEGSRSNFQRIQAVELFSALLKDCHNNQEARDKLGKNMELISSVVVRVIETSNSWKNKKVKKTLQVVNIYAKAAKILVANQAKLSGSFNFDQLRTQGTLIIKAIEKECEKDKTMSNLKGKVKEIKSIVDKV